MYLPYQILRLRVSVSIEWQNRAGLASMRRSTSILAPGHELTLRERPPRKAVIRKLSTSVKWPCVDGSGLLKWVAETVLAPLLARLLPQIIEAQKRGLLPTVDPILFPLYDGQPYRRAFGIRS